VKFLANRKFYFPASYPELLLWQAHGLIIMSILVDDTWVDIAK